MNPFDLSGPPFLVFYWVLVGAALLVIVRIRVRTDIGGEPTSVSTDPYLLAYLRDGHAEAVRVALLVLIEDGIVLVKDRDLSLAPDPGRPDRRSGRPPIERSLIAFLATRHASIDQIVDAQVGYDICIAYQLELEALGYLRPRARLERASAACVLLALLLGLVAVIKIFVALNRGHRNIGFLVLSAFAAVYLVGKNAWAGLPARTSRGERALEGAEALLAGSRQRLRDAGTALSGQELAWIAATYGFSVFNLSPVSFAFWPALYFVGRQNFAPAVMPSQGDSTSFFSSSCGSTGSSCGGGGSSCGGGGCGGCGGS